MTRHPIPLKRLAPFAVLLLAGCMQPGGTTAMGNDGHSPNTPVATSVGAALSCVPLAQLRDSVVRDDWTIDFRIGGDRWYRNVLPYRCNGLGFEKSFSYATSLSQLCSTDIITVLQTGAGGGRRGSCGLGQFQPVTLAK